MEKLRFLLFEVKWFGGFGLLGLGDFVRDGGLLAVGCQGRMTEWDSDEAEPVAASAKKGKGGVQNGLSGLSLSDRMPAAKPPELTVNGGKRREDSESEDDDDAEDDNPFGDINAVNTPKEERPGMTW